jgi:hypothetical protein
LKGKVQIADLLDGGSVNFTLKLWTIITIIVEIFGGILILISVLGLKRETRELMEIDDDEFIPEETIDKLMYYLNLRLAGTIIAAIAGLISIFMK